MAKVRDLSQASFLCTFTSTWHSSHITRATKFHFQIFQLLLASYSMAISVWFCFNMFRTFATQIADMRDDELELRKWSNQCIHEVLIFRSTREQISPTRKIFVKVIVKPSLFPAGSHLCHFRDNFANFDLMLLHDWYDFLLRNCYQYRIEWTLRNRETSV